MKKKIGEGETEIMNVIQKKIGIRGILESFPSYVY